MADPRTGKAMPRELRIAYHRARFAEELPQKTAAAIAGVSESWGIKEDRRVREGQQADLSIGWERKKVRANDRIETAKVAAALDIPPLPYDDLSDQAKHQLEDFHYFCEVQFGLITTPWRRAAFARLWAYWQTAEKEYVIINAPPGIGKSQLSNHDIPIWLTCRDRRIRGLMGSSTDRLAVPATRKIRTSFDRHYPLTASDNDERLGLSVNATSTLIGDFGRFHPDDNALLWQANQFQVELIGTSDSGEKEPTWQAYGRGAEQLGNRFIYVGWDDLVTKRSMNETASTDFIEWFEDEAETRVEPGGLFVLNGQRLGFDLYRNRLDSEIIDIDEDGNEVISKRYHHIVFKAHEADNCTSDHGRDAAPAEFDEETGALVPGTGCLLDPKRQTYREISQIMRSNPRKFDVVYQQQDFSEGSKLIEYHWIFGGESMTGDIFPGCLDTDRDRLQAPGLLEDRTVSVGTVDPSSAKYWSVQWWLNEPTHDIDHLMDLYKGTLTAGELLSFNPTTNEFYGMMDEWQRRSVDLGRPIEAWVVETNAAQRYLLQHKFVHVWMARHGVRIISHKTHAHNKQDSEHGFWAMRNQWLWGKTRLPGKKDSGGFVMSRQLFDEGLRWDGANRGGSKGDDALMAYWIYRVNLDQIVVAEQMQMTEPGAGAAPSWLRQ